MKFLAFVDLHQDLEDLEELKAKVKTEKPEFIINMGDHTIFGHHILEVTYLISKLKKKTYMMYGNHEYKEDAKTACKEYKNLQFVHKEMVEIQGYLFIFYGGGGLAPREPQFKKWIDQNDEKIKSYGENVILVTHAPPKNTALDAVTPKWHVGITEYREFIDKYQPVLAISGHIHESYKQQQILGKTLLVNPGGDGDIFEI